MPRSERSRSIRVRLSIAALVTLSAALVAAGLGLVHIFERHVERRLAAELQTDVRELISGLSVDADGVPSLGRLPRDQRYTQPLSGAYWQVTSQGQVLAKSRSLWDERLTLEEDQLGKDGYHQHVVIGPRSRELLAIERAISVSRPNAFRELRVVAALDHGEVREAVTAFRTDLWAALGVLGVLLLAAFALALGVGLSPLEQIRVGLARMRSGQEERLSGEYPSEVAPLILDLNKVLDERERNARRARSRAADLAHGLKTPLTALEVIADEFREKGEAELADELSGHVARMQHYIERELALARTDYAATPSAPVEVRAAVQEVVQSLYRLPNGASLTWQVNVAPTLRVGLAKGLLTEIVGNLLDNGRKWARSQVTVSAFREGSDLVIEVADDGPGVPAVELRRILQRGRRLDESVPGTGFGLAIVSDIVEDRGGRIEVTDALLGGLGVRVSLPVDA